MVLIKNKMAKRGGRDIDDYFQKQWKISQEQKERARLPRADSQSYSSHFDVLDAPFFMPSDFNRATKIGKNYSSKFEDLSQEERIKFFDIFCHINFGFMTNFKSLSNKGKEKVINYFKSFNREDIDEENMFLYQNKYKKQEAIYKINNDIDSILNNALQANMMSSPFSPPESQASSRATSPTKSRRKYYNIISESLERPIETSSTASASTAPETTASASTASTTSTRVTIINDKAGSKQKTFMIPNDELWVFLDNKLRNYIPIKMR